MKLSVILITYNHAKYLKKAVDGILSQETDFDFEIIAIDDCSTDGTIEMLRAYKKENPGRFRLMIRRKNLGRPTRNVYLASMAARGEYLAYLEGDDYWTDNQKLQKQVDFLDSHPQYMGTTHSFTLIGEEGEPIQNESLERLYDWDGDYTFEDWKRGEAWPGQTASNVCRNFYHNGKLDYRILYRAHDFIDDGVIFTFILLQGPIFRFKAAMAAHRFVEKKEGESWNSIKLRRDYQIEEQELKLRMMRWVEKNVGLTDFGKAKARRDFKAVAGLFVKNPSKRTYALLMSAFLYYIIHVNLGVK
ncbi:MAG: glycosyltransferase [Lachnospiraceae bacterium]|nr:glycosyltransferase [Lachnospiraceae bacterium]